MAEFDIPSAIKARFDYDPETGVLTRKSNGGGPAGTLNSEGYLVTRVNFKQYRVHRVIWVWVHGDWPAGEIDHINGIKTDNRLANLRDVPPSHNQHNKRVASKNSTTGFLGVSRLRGRYKAQIDRAGKTIYLGSFATPEQAHAAYLKGKAEHHPGYRG